MWVLSLLIIVAVAVVALVMIRGTSQEIYGNSPTVADCQSYVKNNLCPEGYACHACADKGNGWFGADCLLGQSSIPSAQNICLQSNMVTAHASQRCVTDYAYYGYSTGTIYWYDSNGVKNDLVKSCSSGCTQISLASASCNDVVVVNPIIVNSSSCDASLGASCTSKGATKCDSATNSAGTCMLRSDNCLHWNMGVCASGTTNVLCQQCFSATPDTSNTVFSTSPMPNGQLYPNQKRLTTPICFAGDMVCQANSISVYDTDGSLVGCSNVVSCPSGDVCRTGSCVALGCTNKCNSGEFGSCTSSTSFKKCQLQSNGCYDYTIGTCPSGYPDCTSAGLCTKKIVSNPSQPSCTNYNQQVCLSASQYSVCDSSGTLLTVSCDPEQQCVGDKCVTPTNPTPTPIDMCAGVVCQDYCSGTTLKSSGTCDSNTGECIYAKTDTASIYCTSSNVSCVRDETVVCGNQTITLASCMNGKFQNVTAIPANCEIPSQGNTFIDKYGLWIGVVLFVVLLVVYLRADAKDKKHKRKK
jgi:hypothetical protein